MNADTVKAVQEALAPIAEKLGEGAAQLYEIYVRQMVAEGIVALIVVAFLAITIATFWRIWWTVRKNNLKEDKYYDTEPSSITGILVGIFTAFFLIFGTLIAAEAGMKIINPQYYAIDRLITTVKGQ